MLLTVLSETDFVYSTNELENKGTECIFCNGKFFKDEQGEIWIECFSWTLSEQKMQSLSMTFINTLEAEMVFI